MVDNLTMWHALIVLTLLVPLALAIVALVSIARNAVYATGGKLLWALIVVIAPFIGSIAWLAWGRRQRPSAG